jgi:hypothetical protein
MMLKNPHGFMHTHALPPPLTAIEVDSQNETSRIHALMMAQPHPPPVEEYDDEAQPCPVSSGIFPLYPPEQAVTELLSGNYHRR